MRAGIGKRIIVLAPVLILLAALYLPLRANAASGPEIDASARATLAEFFRAT